MSLTQLDPRSKGPGWAHFVIDYGQDSALLWVVFMDADGACWTVPNHEVRMVFNWTIGRRKPEAGPERNLSVVPAASADAPEFAPTRLARPWRSCPDGLTLR
jgi:hypothetical protein